MPVNGFDDGKNKVSVKTEEESTAELVAIQATVDSQGETLAGHTQTLSDHTSTLSSHTETLGNHAETLSSHTQTLSNHGDMLSSHTQTLAEHTQEIADRSFTVHTITIASSDWVETGLSPTYWVATKSIIGLQATDFVAGDYTLGNITISGVSNGSISFVATIAKPDFAITINVLVIPVTIS